MAPWDCGPYDDLVQVSSFQIRASILLIDDSFLLKDAQDDIAGTRLKA